ncbi:MAG: DUF3224 domain-containing protein [Mycobacteriales bacterium]
MHLVSGEFEIASWDEDTCQELAGGGKMTRATVTQRYTGGLAGDAAAESVMSYLPDGTARFLGYQRVEGTLGDRTGSLVLESTGEFRDGVAAGRLAVVAGSGTGELAGLRGEGRWEAPSGTRGTFRLEYSFEPAG